MTSKTPPSALLRTVATSLLLVAALLLAPLALAAQSLDGAGAVATGLLLRKLDGVKRVLMIGAHPDDEDTSLLTALGRGHGAETAYLSLTRGDGGQNLLGPELWEGLGVIRTGELEAARARDGGRQFFTRAFDFGYSKTAEEALTFWPREELLRDAVWVVRTFRPHVIVSVFSGTPADGHGRDQAAGVSAREVFEAAGDPERFPEQLAGGVEPWAPAKLYQAAWRRPDEADLVIPTGELDPLLGRSLFQLSMESRSQHRSQDMGAPQPPGPRATRVTFVDARVEAAPDGGLFQGVDTTLVGLAEGLPGSAADRVATHLRAYRASLKDARGAFGLETRPAAAHLADALRHLRQAREAAGPEASLELRRVLSRKAELATRAWLAAAGVVVDARADDDLVVPGQEVELSVLVWNGSRRRLADLDARLVLPEGWTADRGEAEGLSPDGSVAPGALAEVRYRVRVPEDAEPTEPYYLEKERDGAMYRWPADRSLWGLPRDPVAVRAGVSFEPADEDGLRLSTDAPWRYVGVDQARGEFSEPVLVTPELTAAVSPEALAWPQERDEAATVTVTVRSHAPGRREGSVRLEAPADWGVSPAAASFVLDEEGAERSVSFQVEPAGTPSPGDHRLRAVVRSAEGAVYDRAVAVVDYEHIERTLMVTPAETRITVVPVVLPEDLHVGYVMGTGDAGPEAIRQMGARVTLLGPDAVRAGDFGAYDALVLGVRAYETRDDVLAANQQILDFARAGGTVVLQYQQYQFARGGYAPFPMSMGQGRSAPRVSDETAPVRVLHPDAPVFTTPNRITVADFEGWSQERGLYFWAEWDPAYTPLLEMNDAGEPARRGSLLVAEVGEGLFVYAALSFFRQWPTGVSGAYRLFANLISLEAGEWRAWRTGMEGP